ncbi:MAG TPA: HlyD family type I secretion periplasmic adaptor subunit, partial [Rhodospirillales bacterium]|nr:HlyD family type I secretion periplasmic adaptor subunit [Rhodospirillales bacterium]
MALLLAAFLGWCFFAQLDEVAVAEGAVAPQGRVKTVQHLEGGIVAELHVAEGDVVAAGDPLVRLDLATVGVNRRELEARLDGEVLRRQRLRAEAEGGVMAAPAGAVAEAAARQPELAEAEARAFGARRRELAAAEDVVRAQVRQRKLAVDELEARAAAVRRNLALAMQRLEMSEELLAEELTARMEHLELKSEVESLQGEVQSLVPAVPAAQAAVAEAERRLHELGVRFRREAEQQLGACEQSIAQLRELLAEADDQGRRTSVRSPINGIVDNIRTTTIGGVIGPGEPLMDIVPTNGKLVIEAKLRAIDRGYVREGQPAVVKIGTYDFVRYGALEGTVIRVAPDAAAGERGEPYFPVTVETAKSHLGDEAGPLPITSGMQATVDIHTGTRTVIDYLVKPV